jgi:RNA polymerase sigma factor (sigma-70 family)
MRDDPVVTGLVIRARNGEAQAWDAIVERYAPLIWSICRRYRLGAADADDVGQQVWLQLVDHLGQIRDPAALPGWLATATRRECARVQRAARGEHAGYALDAEVIADQHAQTVEQQLLDAERHAALREAFARLPASCQQLITLLIQDPPVPYATISARLNIPVGSIGPNRGRCLDRLRRDPAIAALISAPAGNAENPVGGQLRKGLTAAAKAAGSPTHGKCAAPGWTTVASVNSGAASRTAPGGTIGSVPSTPTAARPGVTRISRDRCCG